MNNSSNNNNNSSNNNSLHTGTEDGQSLKLIQFGNNIKCLRLQFLSLGLWDRLTRPLAHSVPQQRVVNVLILWRQGCVIEQWAERIPGLDSWFFEETLLWKWNKNMLTSRLHCVFYESIQLIAKRRSTADHMNNWTGPCRKLLDERHGLVVLSSRSTGFIGQFAVDWNKQNHL